MLNTLKDLFDSFSPAAAHPAADSDHAVRLAAAVLLVEVARAEPASTPAEGKAVVAALHKRFSFANDELSRLVELAEAEAKDLYDYHRFTSVLNDRFTQAEKVALVEAMWQVAYADEHLDAHENHLISKVAGLLHVTHGEYIAAKMRAKEVAGLD
ncbi:MAG: TerB family tellurite resistance protein [Hydrogenophaga sp.]|nr:TerB family tellurite resistance protein [Hydrogenophaga sp.]